MNILGLETIEIDNVPIVLNKHNAETAANAFQKLVLDEGHSAVAIYEKLNFLYEVAEKFCDDKMTSIIREEIAKYGKTHTTPNGTVLSPCETKTYSYDHDPIWNYYKKQEEHYAKHRKARESVLKLTPEPTILKNTQPVEDLDPETGEMFLRYPAKIVKTTESFKTSLK